MGSGAKGEVRTELGVAKVCNTTFSSCTDCSGVATLGSMSEVRLLCGRSERRSCRGEPGDGGYGDDVSSTMVNGAKEAVWMGLAIAKEGNKHHPWFLCSMR